MGINWDRLKALHLQGDRASQLNSLYFNLARLQVLATGHTDEPVALHLIRESQCFIEWIVPTLDLETDDISVATSLVDLQRQLSRWKLEWGKCWSEKEARENLVTQAAQWCDFLGSLHCDRPQKPSMSSPELYQQV